MKPVKQRKPAETSPFRKRVLAYEKLLLVRTLQHHGGSVNAAREDLGLRGSRMYDLMKKHGLRIEDYRE